MRLRLLPFPVLTLVCCSGAVAAESAAMRTVTGKNGEVQIVLKTDQVQVTLAPAAGGTVRLIETHDVVTVLKTGWYAHHVAHGKLFSDMVRIGGDTLDLAGLAYGVDAMAESETSLRVALSASAGDQAEGLRVSREFSLARGACRLLLRRQFTNRGAEPLRLQIGCRYLTEPEAWSSHHSVRLFAGAGKVQAELLGWGRDPQPTTRSVRLEPGGAAPWFVEMNTFGQALASRFEAPDQALTFDLAAIPRADARPTPGASAQVEVWMEEMTLAPGKSVALTSQIAIMKAVTGVAGLAQGELLYGADVPRFRPPQHRFPVYATISAPSDREIEVRFRRRRAGAPDWTPIATRTLVAQAGENADLHVPIRIDEPGEHEIRISFAENGREIAALTRPVGIADPANPPPALAEAAQTWALRMPEVHCQGSWEEIGRQLFKAGRAGLDPQKLARAAAAWKTAGNELRARAEAALAFYGEHLPEHIALLRGATAAAGVPLEAALPLDFPAPDEPEEAGRKGCMDIAVLNGPDGPLAAWSNEGYYRPERRCYYLRVQPATGYAFHAMDACGVNEKGLSISSALLSEHPRDGERFRAAVTAWREAGNFVLPRTSADRGNVCWILARCATVAEALAFLQNPEARVSMTGNVLLVDRDGDAAVVQSVGFFRHVRRPVDGILTCANYPGGSPDGKIFTYAGNARLFFNGILRERRAQRVLREAGSNMTLEALRFLLMNRQVPGSICQRKEDNNALYITTTSWMASCRTGDLYLCWGSPWQTGFGRYALTAPAP